MSLTIYKSSAGSGKTYTLAKEYIKLALTAADYYTHILAVTFTNRAAEEMKERVLDYLMAIAKGQHELVSILAKELGKTETEIQTRAGQTITHLLHHYGFFGIMTIDTFFHKIIRSFSREIGLQGSFGIEMEADKVADFIASDVYRGAEENDQLRKWLVDFSMAQLADGRGYEQRRSISGLAKEIFKDALKQLKGGAFLTQDLKVQIKELQKELDDIKRGFEGQLQAIGKEFQSLLVQHHLSIDDFNFGTSGVAGFFLKVERKELKSPIGSRVRTALEDAGSWTKKSNDRRDEILRLVESQFMPLLQKGVAYFEANERAYITANLVSKNLYTLGLLNDLAQRLQEYKQEKEIIMISDLPDFLNKIIDDSGSPFIYEKVGSRYYHFLIDEFQDTSRLQWQNFKPLLEESNANGYHNIIVGDAKQSIYAWRGGDPTLLLQGVQQDIPQAEVLSNTTNWRSAKNIVTFNNEVFSALPTILCSLMSDQLEETQLALIQSAYADVAQEVAPANEQIEGLVEVEFLASEKGEDWREIAMAKVVERIEMLLQEGHQLNDMAMLVRTNWEAAFIVNYVLDYKRSTKTIIEVISSDGMLLANANVVQVLLHAYRYLLNPSDSQVCGNLVYAFNKIQGKDFVHHDDFLLLMQAHLPADFLNYRDHLQHLPILELTEVLIRAFELNKVATEYTYLQAFQDAVLEFSKNNRSDIRLFLEWWEEVGVKRSVQLTGALDAIEIITSHKSKGLQYPIVFVPFCNFDFDGKPETTFWLDASDAQPVDKLAYVPMNYSSALDSTSFSAQYREELGRFYLESLNVLYVAFTRAETGLFVYGQTPPKNPSNMHSTANKLLWTYFEQHPSECWDGTTYKKGSLPKKHIKRDDELTHLQGYISNKWSHKLTVRTTGRAYYDDEREKQRAEGILLHQILSEIHHWQQTEEVLDGYVKRMEITQEDRLNYEKLLLNLWQDEQVKSWFDSTGTVKTEVVVLPKDGETKRMDRVVLRGNEATVIDFKNGAPKAQDDRQVKEYVSLLDEMGYAATGFLLYLKTGEVREVNR